MRVLFDAYWWQRGPGANRTVQRELLLAWTRAFPHDELIVALRRDAEAAGLPDGAGTARTSLWPHALSNRWELPRIASRTSADIVVCHNYTPASGPSLVFIHDVMFLEQPQWFSRAERAYFAPMLPWARRASIVAVSTETEAARVLRHAPRLRPPVVTGLGVPPGLQGAMQRPPAIAADAEFAVTVGRLNVRKNLETVMNAAARSRRITPTSPLVVVGGVEHSGRGSTVPERARPLLQDGRIVMLGPVPDEQLAWLYAHAALTISLSLDEGFGMPSVEAASFGSPLLVSDIPVFRETVGDYAAFVPPLDEAAAAAQLDATWGARPSAAARERAIADYTWDAAVRRLRGAIRSARLAD
ncbi:glycosyltransferase family 1 protein [Agrococcus sp. ProA11]|uniref:glycosyltransferase family 4 protein n=1 Tax=Agrococcus chionoecetis TaxID=3153752 RepID=UPI0032609AE9